MVNKRKIDDLAFWLYDKASVIFITVSGVLYLALILMEVAKHV